jgi:hypothetical protein
MDELCIDRRFRGPPETGNGGYVAGMVARALGGSDCIVTLRLPPPLDAPLALRRAGDGVELLAGERLVATGTPASIDVAVPAPPSLEAAEAAEARFTGHRHHIFPGCFVCGPDRAPGDGLRIFPGRIDDGQVAAVWRPDTGLADADGRVRGEFLWAALDCPGYFAVEEACGRALLGRLGARLVSRPRAGEPLIVTAWSIDRDGRKHRAGSALHDRDGRLVAAAVATWITLQA